MRSSSIRSRAGSRTSGLATLFSYRLSRDAARTFSLTANDYGFGLLSPTPIALTLGELGRLLAAPGVEADMLAGLNAAELGRRQFREIARIAGLTFQGYPGEPNPARQLQASSALLYEVFAEYDPENLLLRQAVREVLERRLEAPRIAAALARLRRSRAAADASGAADAVRVSAAGRDVPRGALHRGARCARRADGRGARTRGGGSDRAGCVTLLEDDDARSRRCQSDPGAAPERTLCRSRPRHAVFAQYYRRASSRRGPRVQGAPRWPPIRSTSPARWRSSPAPTAASASRSRGVSAKRAPPLS